MEVSNDDAKKLLIDFSQRYINLQIQKKNIDLDIKALKEEFEEQGLSTKLAVKVINTRKKDKKISQNERDNFDLYSVWFCESKELEDSLTDLIHM